MITKIAAFKGVNQDFKKYIDSLATGKPDDQYFEVQDTEQAMAYALKNISDISLNLNQTYSDAVNIFAKIKELEAEFDKKAEQYMKLAPQLGNARCKLLKLTQKYRDLVTVNKEG